jgi:hypothetical protein
MKNLVIAMANEKSVHDLWLADWSTHLRWDVALFNYGNGNHKGTIDISEYIDPPPQFKWQLMNRLLDSNFIFEDFKYIWLVDDDVQMSTQDVTRFFFKCEELEISVAQPCLTPNSFVSHPITLQHDFCDSRQTNFVEIMMPCFSQAAWRKLKYVDRFNTLTGWGLEIFWSSVLFSSTTPFHIFDDISVCHSRPLGLGRFKWLPEGYDVRTSMHDEVNRHKIDQSAGWFRCNLKLTLKSGEIISYTQPEFIYMLARSVGNYYRRSSPSIAGLQYIKLSEKFDSSEFSKFREVPTHAAFGEYLLSHVFLNEYSYL